MSQIRPAAAAENRGDSRFQQATTFVWRLVKVVLICYLLVLLMMMFLENALIFPAPRYPSGDWEHGLQDIHFESEDGTKLHGLLLEHDRPSVYILFCHGNGEHVAYTRDLIQSYHDDMNATVFAFDYRGYGRSEGKPHEIGVLEDGRAAQEWLAQHAGIPPSEIVLIGRSLGGAVAVDLAAANGAKALVLERTFTRMPDVAARLYPFLPVRFLMRTQFNSIGKITTYDGPLLQSHGTVDAMIPYDLGRQLFEAAPSDRKQFYDEVGLGHNDAYSPGYWSTLQTFLRDASRS